MATQSADQLAQYYANLLIYQYVTMPKAYQTTYADVAPILMPTAYITPLEDSTLVGLTDSSGIILCSLSTLYGPILYGQILPLLLQDAFTLSTAVGVQLDILAEYIGGVRTNLQLNGAALTFTDAQFETYLLALAARNNLGSDMHSIEVFFNQYFPGVFITSDFESMNMSFMYIVAFGANPVAEAFITSGHLPVPMAVGYTVVYNPAQVYSFFAFRTYNVVAQPGTSGYNFYNTTQVGKYMSYANVIPGVVIS